MSTPKAASTDPPREETEESPSVSRAARILAVYYLTLPFGLVYLLFKIFPPYPWPTVTVVEAAIQKVLTVESQQICFFFGKLCFSTSLEERLILLVIAAGALGSYIHSATSFADYRGNRQFCASWMMWYLLRPMVGVCLALVVYFALRGGLLLLVNGSDATEARDINPFGVAAMAGLTGMFSKQAADKLAEVFTTLFRSAGDQNRRDSLTKAPAPDIKDIDPNEGSSAGATNVTITGTGFASEAKVLFGSNPATNVTVVSATTITADTPPGAGVVDVTVENADGQKATNSEAFTYLAADGDGASAGAGDAVDGCDVELKEDTQDEDLPITEGGVA